MIKILHLSDTHGCHHRLKDLPAADIIIHSGDFTMNGSEAETIDFMNWFCDLSYSHKIFICGNHDECLYGAKISGLDDNIHYLCHSGIEIEGLKFYGVPMFMTDCITGHQANNYAKIPIDTEVLITHSPGYGMMDFDDNIHYGSKDLQQQLKQLKLKAHLFGHIHKQHGVCEQNHTIYSNGAIMNEDYTHLNTPNVLILK